MSDPINYGEHLVMVAKQRCESLGLEFNDVVMCDLATAPANELAAISEKLGFTSLADMIAHAEPRSFRYEPGELVIFRDAISLVVSFCARGIPMSHDDMIFHLSPRTITRAEFVIHEGPRYHLELDGEKTAGWEDAIISIGELIDFLGIHGRRPWETGGFCYRDGRVMRAQESWQR